MDRLPDVAMLLTPPGLDPVGDYIAELAGEEGRARCVAELEAWDRETARRLRLGIRPPAWGPRQRSWLMTSAELLDRLAVQATGDEALAQENALRAVAELMRREARGHLLRSRRWEGRALERAADAVDEVIWKLTERSARPWR